MLSLITAEVPERLSKRFMLAANGELVKEPGGALVRGFYQRQTIDTPAALAALVSGLGPDQALALGVADSDLAPIASRAAQEPGDITRTREHFDWPQGPGWMLIDYDPLPGTEPMPWPDFAKVLTAVWPAFATAPAVASPSGSTFIYHGDRELRGLGGLRAWVQVADARDIPRAGQALFERLWLGGQGFYAVSKSGALLERGPIDAAVWQPERLDFAAGAACEPPLEQRRPTPRILNGDAVPVCTLASLPDLTAEERIQLEAMKETARASVAEEQARARAAWIASRMAVIEEKLSAMPEEKREEKRAEARQVLTHAVTQRRLYAAFELRHASGRTVTVGELLKDPKQWHGERFADPLEPDYGRDRRIAYANLRSGATPYLFSHAHGGQRFDLLRAATVLRVTNGDMPQLVAQADRLVAEAGEIYQRGGQLVRLLDDATLLGVSGPWLRTHLETIGRFTRWDARSKAWVATDCPGELHTRLLHRRGAWASPELTATVRAPILRPDGSLLSTPGYDAATGVLLLADHPDGWPRILEAPTLRQVYEAVRVLWEPFATLPFVSALDRSVHLAAALTAVQRPMLPTAPAFGWSAHKAGSGKGKAAKAVAWLSGHEPIETPWPTEPEEQRKKLLAKLVAAPPALLIDNVNGRLNSDALNVILTATTYEDRILGRSETVSASTRLLVLVTGNNVSVTGDLSRRVLVATIDHGVEAPERLEFAFDPVARMRERWLHYRAAALTILRGFIAAGMPSGGPGAMGSFEDWDRLIRQCVVWLRDNEAASFELADPADAVQHNYQNDPETQRLGALIEGLYAVFGEKVILVNEVISKIELGNGSTFSHGVRDQDLDLDALAATVREIAGLGKGINARSLGNAFSNAAGRILDGKRIVRAGERQGRALWRVERLNPQ